MSRVAWVVPLLAVSLIGWSGSAALAQETKTARGTVTATSGDSVTVKVRSEEMKFTVDDKTEVIATGAGHQAAAAKEKGSGVKLEDVIKTGNSVEVKYHDMGGGTLHAASVRKISTAGAGSLSTDEPTTKRTTGKVKSVAADSLTVTAAGDKDMTFNIDTKTHVVATGAGTKAAGTGGKLASITEAVKEGDMVSVTYHDMGGTLHAAEVRVTRKAAK
jgi:Domain of unknown function (DUF5666)